MQYVKYEIDYRMKWRESGRWSSIDHLCQLVSWIGPEPEGFAIMPSTVRISDTELLTTLRRREGTFRWISAWRSQDNAKTWTQENHPVEYLGEGRKSIKLNQSLVWVSSSKHQTSYRNSV